MKEDYMEKLPVDEMNPRSVEFWLISMAKKGYILSETAWSWWYFRKGTPKKVRYRLKPLQVGEKSLDPEKRKEYEAMGWRYMTTHDGRYHIFMTESPDTEDFPAVPLERDMFVQKNMQMLRQKQLLSFTYIFFFLYVSYLLYEGQKPGLALFLVNPFFMFSMAGLTMLTYTVYRDIWEYRELHKLGRKIEAGRAPELEYKKFLVQKWNPRKERIQFGLIISVFLLLFIPAVMLRKGEIGPEARKNPLPTLETLESGKTVMDITEKGYGKIRYEFSLFLKERYGFSQKAMVKLENSISGDESEVSTLTAELYDAYFTWLAEALYNELKMAYIQKDSGGLHRDLIREGYEAYFVLEDGKRQTLVARRGKKVLVLVYNGAEKLREKDAALGGILDS